MNALLTGGGDPASHPPLTMKDVIEGYTLGGMRTTCLKDIGMLDIGYNADLVVYDQDLFTLSPEEFTKDHPKVVSTWVGGAKVFG